jgi:hypothetical protein
VGGTEITTPTSPVILSGGGDYEHRLAHEARKSKPKQGEAR